MTDVSSSEDSSDEEDIVTIALTNEEAPLPPPPMCLMAKGNTKVNYKAGGKHWVLESGCSQHMTGNDSMFTSLEDPGDLEHVTYGGNSRGKVLGLGRIAISKDLSISNVLFVESLSFNLTSIAQLCDLGLTCTFDKNGVVVTLEEDKSLVFMGFKHGNIYLVDFSSKQISSMTCLFTKSSLGWLWHRRIAHILA